MDTRLTIVMYHYVRELKHSRFPEIKGLTTDDFREQLRYIQKYYTVISGDELLDSLQEGASLPPRPLLLTFDDGYIDNFTQVFPILDQYHLRACFFPSVKCIVENELLNVNKIHFILASAPDKAELVDFINGMVDDARGEFALKDRNYYWGRLAKSSRYDSKEVVFVKKMLQRELPVDLRTRIANTLFRKYVSVDQAAFARELYMSVEQIECLARHGMYIGGHGYEHLWLNSADKATQKREIELTIEFLNRVSSRTDRWIMAYPYGAFNDPLLALLKGCGCKIGLTTKVGIADLGHDEPLTLPRLNTNDLPTNALAEPNDWTLQVIN